MQGRISLPVLGILGVATGAICWMLIRQALIDPLDKAMAKSFANLHRLQEAIRIYQDDYGSVPSTGDGAQMHLPPFSAEIDNILSLPQSAYHCPCYEIARKSEMWSSPEFNYWNDDESKVFSDSTPIYTSLDCNQDARTVGAPLMQHRGIGITLGGNLINILKPGNVADPSWWSSNSLSGEKHQ